MITIVVNVKAGTADRLGQQGISSMLAEACAEAGIDDVRVILEKPSGMESRLRELADAGGEIWVGGGDGTIRTAGRLFRGSPTVLGVLPFGTMNLLARDLGIPLEPKEAVAALARAPVIAIDVGRIGDDIFLNKSALGLYPEMIIDRDRRRRLFGYGKWYAMLRAAWRTFRRHRLMNVTVEVEGQKREIVSPAVVVALEEYEFEAGRLFHRRDLCTGLLTVYVSHQLEWLGSVGQVIRMFLGTLRQDPKLEVIKVERVDIDFRHSRPVANDGEVEFVRGPVHYAVEPRALNVRYPAPPSGGQGETAGR